MAQTTNPFVQTPSISIECNMGEKVPFQVALFPNVDIHQIYKVLPAGCPCTQDFMIYNNRITGKYNDGHTKKDFEAMENPSFIFIERQFAIWYKKEGIEPEVVNDRGGLVINNQLPWETVTLNIKVNNK